MRARVIFRTMSGYALRAQASRQRRRSAGVARRCPRAYRGVAAHPCARASALQLGGRPGPDARRISRLSPPVVSPSPPDPRGRTSRPTVLTGGIRRGTECVADAPNYKRREHNPGQIANALIEHPVQPEGELVGADPGRQSTQPGGAALRGRGRCTPRVVGPPRAKRGIVSLPLQPPAASQQQRKTLPRSCTTTPDERPMRRPCCPACRGRSSTPDQPPRRGYRPRRCNRLR